jgi:hypothetical protein
MALAFLAGWLGEAYVGEHAWTAEGRIRAVGGRKLRPELRLAASMFDATPTRADLV